MKLLCVTCSFINLILYVYAQDVKKEKMLNNSNIRNNITTISSGKLSSFYIFYNL